jgi:hypothetical protein
MHNREYIPEPIRPDDAFLVLLMMMAFEDE